MENDLLKGEQSCAGGDKEAASKTVKTLIGRLVESCKSETEISCSSRPCDGERQPQLGKSPKFLTVLVAHEVAVGTFSWRNPNYSHCL